QLLATDVTMWADGGGKARGAAIYPLRGAAAVAQFVRGSVKLLPAGAQVELAAINGELAAIARVAGPAMFVLAITVDQDRVSEIRVVGNPDKLHWVSLPPQVNDHSDEVKE